MSGTYVDPERMIELGNQFIGKADELRSNISSFRNNISGLRGSWDGDAAKTLESASEDFISQILEPLQMSLEEKGQRMVTAGQNQSASEDERARTIGQNL